MTYALDLGTRLGWAYGLDRIEQSGTLVLPDQSLGHRMFVFREWLYGRLHELTDVWYEAPHAHSGASRDIVYGLQGILLAETVRANCTAQRIAANTLKKYTTGDGRCGKFVMMMAASQIAGRHVKCDDEADAVCLWAMATTKGRSA